MRTRVVVGRRLRVMLKRLEIRKRRFANRAAIILFRGFLFLDGMDVLMETKVGQCVEHLAAYVTSILGTLVALGVFEKIVQFGKHHATAALHAFVNFKRQMRDDEVTF